MPLHSSGCVKKTGRAQLRPTLFNQQAKQKKQYANWLCKQGSFTLPCNQIREVSFSAKIRVDITNASASILPGGTVLSSFCQFFFCSVVEIIHQYFIHNITNTMPAYLFHTNPPRWCSGRITTVTQETCCKPVLLSLDYFILCPYASVQHYRC